MNQDLLKAIYLTNNGRIGRLAYLGYGLGLGIAVGIVAGIVISLLGMIGIVIAFVLYVASLYCQYNIAAKRFQDLNQPGQYALYMMGAALVAFVLSMVNSLSTVGSLLDIPVLLAALYLLLMPGTQGSNNYGPAPGAIRGVQ